MPAAAAEAWIRIGQIHVTVGNHAAALAAFERAQAAAAVPSLNYLSHFLAGRALEALDRPDDAAAEYRKALAIVPQAESATIALASLLFQRNEREASVALIDQAFAAPGAPTDPGRLTGYGFYLQWPAIKAAMRAELTK
jgi:tetratricopeptide (TPR) repeat protein